MAMLTLELPVHEKQRAFNLRRLAELLADPELARIEGRIETDRYGHVVLSPPPAPSHGTSQCGSAPRMAGCVFWGRPRCSPRDCAPTSRNRFNCADLAPLRAAACQAAGPSLPIRRVLASAERGYCRIYACFGMFHYQDIGWRGTDSIPRPQERTFQIE